MKIKNFKINQNTVSKLTAYVLIGSLTATTLIGCGTSKKNKENVLQGTLLEKASVVTFDDGSKDVAVALNTCDDSDFYHYRSLVSGEYFSDYNCHFDYFDGRINHRYVIVDEESIINYLTTEELSKAFSDGLSNDDIIVIISRIIKPITETNTNSR